MDRRLPAYDITELVDVNDFIAPVRPRFGGKLGEGVVIAGGGSTTQRRGETPSQAMHRLEDEVAAAQHCPDCGQRVDPQDPEAVDPGDTGGHWWHRACMRAAEDFAERS